MQANQARSGLAEAASLAVLKRIFSENIRYHYRTYILAGLCLALASGATAFLAFIVKDVVDEIFVRENTALIPIIAAAIFLAFAVRSIAGYFQAILLAKVGNNVVARYQRRIFAHLLALDMRFHMSDRSARLTARINGNINGIRSVLNTALVTVSRDLVTLIGLVGVMIYQEPILTIVVLLVGPLLFYLLNRLMRRLRKEVRRNVGTVSNLFGTIQETVQGIAVVKAFTMEPTLKEQFGHLNRKVERQSNKVTRLSERASPITDMIIGGAIALAVWFTASRSLASGVPPGSMASFIAAMLLAYEPAKKLAKSQIQLEKAIVNARMVYELLDVEPAQQDAPGNVDLVVDKGAIRFEDVWFGYVEERHVLKGLTLDIPAGRTVAIIGRSGAGKSTLITLLLRFFDPSRGRILIDGQDIAEVTKTSLRGSVAYVSQHPYLFEGSVADNIRNGRPDATDEEVHEAAMLANADEFIKTLEKGYDTPLGENGTSLSGGQRQRLSIARAILRDAPILLLDEATSALDNESEKKVQDALEQVMKGRTTIVVAHRLSTVQNAHSIIVLENGEVMEQGTHAELMALPKGLYRRYREMREGPSLDLASDAAE
ncbi:ABC transporter ATP-binding protein [Notoacmeibacter ruber]|uniref:ABC transporter ATP-binding protein n=1 Tax=Notoacmeibacter ruber TaxID=2670375 RepID=A0A3L7JES0_9HYPH|nr:ABC transporter ATP-binding protein [Notoacmeibacter ruber]RLQ89267.1 ABC transporter ATP-binding protein [Notoacmeibacter ruber]